MKRLLILLLVVAIAPITKAQDSPAKIEVQKIYNEAPHSAFTSMVRFKNRFYCTFREALAHVSGPQGKARVIMSVDEGKTWNSMAYYKMDGMDIRDPKISITPDGLLMVLIDVETYADNKVDTRKPWVIYSDKNGENFSEPVESTIDPAIAEKSDWVWRVSWYNGTGYAIDYKNAHAFLVKTKDGKSFENIAQLDIDGYPNEATVRFDKKGKIYVVVRREQGDQRGMLATAIAPYTKWEYNKMDERLGGPDFLFLDDNTLCIGSRLYPTDTELAKKIANHKAGFIITDLKGKTKKIVPIPESGGDCSYPGMLIYNNQLWASFYSSHEDKTSIYLAKVPLSLLK
jgi:hypothetical protein